MTKPVYHCFLAFATASFALAADAEVREMDMAIASRLDPSATVWDMSALDRLDSAGGYYECFGDSLVGECVDGRTRWYGFVGDSVAWLREEDRLMYVNLDRPAPTSAWGNATAPLSAEFAGKGLYCRRMHVLEQGQYTADNGRDGLIATASGDTVAARMTAETVRFRARLSSFPSSGENLGASDTLPDYTVTRYRWFAGERLPVAVMTVMEEQSGSQSVSSRTTAYTIGADRLADALSHSDNALRVKISGDGITVSLADGSPSKTIAVAITTLDGLPALSATAEISAGSPLTIPCGHLPHGKYIAGINDGRTTIKEYLSL